LLNIGFEELKKDQILHNIILSFRITWFTAN